MDFLSNDVGQCLSVPLSEGPLHSVPRPPGQQALRGGLAERRLRLGNRHSGRFLFRVHGKEQTGKLSFLKLGGPGYANTQMAKAHLA